MARKKNRKKPNRRARLRARGRKFRKRAEKGIAGNWGKISNAIGVVAFIAQLTAKDRQAGIYDNKSKGDQAKQLVNNLTGRIFGYNPFSDQVSFDQTINIDGIANRTTGAGIVTWIYGRLPVKGLPHKSKAKTLSSRLLSAGILGGVFDAPENDTRNRVQAQRPAPRITAHNQVSTT